MSWLAFVAHIPSALTLVWALNFRFTLCTLFYAVAKHAMAGEQRSSACCLRLFKARPSARACSYGLHIRGRKSGTRRSRQPTSHVATRTAREGTHLIAISSAGSKRSTFCFVSLRQTLSSCCPPVRTTNANPSPAGPHRLEGAARISTHLRRHGN